MISENELTLRINQARKQAFEDAALVMMRQLEALADGEDPCRLRVTREYAYAYAFASYALDKGSLEGPAYAMRKKGYTALTILKQLGGESHEV